ncbi:MAG: hypothetical protein COA42_15170 [Alteromonadaceae bacterium]|nr:MAG: hypothetical protein COA42_15170 [Alteromonadaceae bacterium]
MKSHDLQRRLLLLEPQTRSALFSYRQAQVLFADEAEKTLYQALRRHQKNGIIEQVCKGVWQNPMSRYIENDTRLEELALLLRPDHYNVVSLETVLSQASVISQQMFAYLTVMTTGQSKCFKTPFGTLELTHTKRKLTELSRYKVPPGHRLPWVGVDVAYRDLKRVGRNVDLVDEEVLEEILSGTSSVTTGVNH